MGLNVWDGLKIVEHLHSPQILYEGDKEEQSGMSKAQGHALLVSSLGSTIVAAAATTKDGSERAPVQPARQVAAILPLNALQEFFSVTEVPPELFSRNLFFLRELLEEILRKHKQNSEFRTTCVRSWEALWEQKPVRESTLRCRQTCLAWQQENSQAAAEWFSTWTDAQ